MFTIPKLMVIDQPIAIFKNISDVLSNITHNFKSISIVGF